MDNQEIEISYFHGNTVSYFYGDGLNVSAKELGYEEIKWRTGDKIEVTEYDRELGGELTEYYTINKIEHDEDGKVYASVHYSGNSLEE